MDMELGGKFAILSRPEGWATPHAVESLMRQHGDSILRLCFVYLGDYHLAEDAMQETFLKAYRGYGRFRGDSGEKTWLTRIAINVCKDIKKSAWMRRVNRGISLTDIPEPAVPPVEADDTLITAVMALPGKLREAVLLFYYMGLPAAEVASALKIALPTVYKRLDKAQSILKTELEGWYETD